MSGSDKEIPSGYKLAKYLEIFRYDLSIAKC